MMHLGGYLEYREGYLEYLGGCLEYREGYHDARGGVKYRGVLK